ncbi:glycosyltransferase family 8 protein [Paracoccus aestuariivivens]|uniref:Glycosyltransferase family 8 protein n=1 Tax=Paracoccus aestuariivivens TaxID=1820333 RepID=A0A6L6J948_9RHOB|nr:glycosyltransferase family 8 protein [Paracoccus aestuariivivens]MTH78036.1 glycosyltransferase family 8 protein [Paracoccus aestuariivivens]
MDIAGPEADFAIVTCADHKMLPAACCSLLSAHANLTCPARFVLVALDLTKDDSDAVAKFGQKHGIGIELHPFASDQLPDMTSGRWPKAVLARLFLDHVIFDKINRLLYLDADTLVARSVEPLRSIDLRGRYVAAVDDFIMAFPKKLQSRRDAIGLRSGSSYFNSGVMLFDWPASLAASVLQTARDNIADRSENYHATDQDALNAALEGKWLRLDPTWNVQTGFLPSIQTPAILHFTGRRKPWQAGASWQHRSYSKIYRDYLEGTRWESTCRKPGLGRNMANLALYLGKRLENLRKSRSLRQYLEECRKYARSDKLD